MKIGILGAAGYTGGELLRLLLNHPDATIRFAHSNSNAGNLVSDVHAGLLGDTETRFCSDIPLDDVDVLFLCMGHGKSRDFIDRNSIPEHVRIIDLAQDFRTGSEHIPVRQKPHKSRFVYGLPEFNRGQIRQCRRLANPGCFATCIQLGLLPLASKALLTHDICVNAITGSTGAGQNPGATTHFSWRNDNISVYKPFTHQHIGEVCQTLNEANPDAFPCVVPPTAEPRKTSVSLDFIPYRGCFTRGIFCTSVVRLDKLMDRDEVVKLYKDYYETAMFTHYSDKPIDLKQVVNTNKALVHAEVFGHKLVITSAIDNLLKGAVGQAVQNMNIMLGLPEDAGLHLKASAF